MWKFPSFKSALKPKADIPGMVSSDEMAFFSESAARYVGREGAIVDLGCWLGSTSIALAQGILSHGPNANYQKEKVLGFDRFIWEAWMPAHIPSCLYESGDTFLPEARRVVRDHGGGRVELIQTDLALYEWRDGPIKILLVDAMKNEDLTRQIARTFYPSLIPGGLLIHQDFNHYYTGWIHMLQYRLRQYFRLDRSVTRSGTVAFEVLAPLPREAIDRATDFATSGGDEIAATFRHSLDLVGPGDCVNVAAAHVMYYVHLKRKDRALETLEAYRPLGLLDRGEFPTVLSCVDQMP
jgi:hypothetical protein